jgi:hypothetical protein
MKKIASLFVFLALIACGSSDKPELSPDASSTEAVQEAPTPEPEVRTDNLICPQVAVLREADEEFDYGGEKPNPGQLVAKARLGKITGDCAYRKKEGSETGIDISFKLEALAMRGPRLGGDQVSFPYFLAVVDPSDVVLSRQLMTAQFHFSGDNKVAELAEPLHVFIPLPIKDLPSGPHYRVLIGFTKSIR